MQTAVDRLRRLAAADPFTVVEAAALFVLAVLVLATGLPEWVAAELSSTPWLVVAPLFGLLILARTFWELRGATQHTARPETPMEGVRVLWRTAESVVALVLVAAAAVAVLVTVTGIDLGTVRAGLALQIAVVYVLAGYAILPLLGGRLVGSVAYRLVRGLADRTGT